MIAMPQPLVATLLLPILQETDQTLTVLTGLMLQYSPKKFVSPNGFIVNVGRNARENSLLTLSKSKDEDIFFHVADYPGSHVVMEISQNIPLRSDLEFCAQLAAKHSKAKKLPIAVDYTAIKNVYKIKGAPTGTVGLQKFKTIKIKSL